MSEVNERLWGKYDNYRQERQCLLYAPSFTHMSVSIHHLQILCKIFRCATGFFTLHSKGLAAELNKNQDKEPRLNQTRKSCNT